MRRTAEGKLLVLTLAQELVGGGVKDENIQMAKARVASCLLDRGAPLPETTVATERLVQAAGAPACLKALTNEDAKTRWEALCQVADSARG